MRKGSSLMEMLVVCGVLAVCLYSLSRLYITFLVDVPRQGAMVDENRQVELALDRLRGDLEQAVGLPAARGAWTSSPDCLLIELPDKLVAWQYAAGVDAATTAELGDPNRADPNMIRRVNAWYAGGNSHLIRWEITRPDTVDPNSNDSTDWWLGHAVVQWEKWTSPAGMEAMQVRTAIANKVSGRIYYNWPNSHLYFIGHRPAETVVAHGEAQP